MNAYQFLQKLSKAVFLTIFHDLFDGLQVFGQAQPHMELGFSEVLNLGEEGLCVIIEEYCVLFDFVPVDFEDFELLGFIEVG